MTTENQKGNADASGSPEGQAPTAPPVTEPAPLPIASEAKLFR